MSIISYFQSGGTKIIYDPTLANNTPKAIQKAASSGVAADYWSVGDTIPITLNGSVELQNFSNETWNAFIIGFDHNAELEGLDTIHFQFGKAEDGTDVAFVDKFYDDAGLDGGYCMNKEPTNSGGWKTSFMRNYICDDFFMALPSEWQDVIRSCTKFTNNIGDETGDEPTNVTGTADNIFLLSEYELMGEISLGYDSEKDYQEQYAYYADGNSFKKHKCDAPKEEVVWWLRSPVRIYNGSFVAFNSRYYDTDYIDADNIIAFAPGFMVG